MGNPRLESVMTDIVEFLAEEFPRAFSSRNLGTRFNMNSSSIAMRIKKCPDIEKIPILSRKSSGKFVYRYKKEAIKEEPYLHRLLDELEKRGFTGIKMDVLNGSD